MIKDTHSKLIVKRGQNPELLTLMLVQGGNRFHEGKPHIDTEFKREVSKSAVRV